MSSGVHEARVIQRYDWLETADTFTLRIKHDPRIAEIQQYRAVIPDASPGHRCVYSKVYKERVLVFVYQGKRVQQLDLLMAAKVAPSSGYSAAYDIAGRLALPIDGPEPSKEYVQGPAGESTGDDPDGLEEVESDDEDEGGNDASPTDEPEEGGDEMAGLTQITASAEKVFLFLVGQRPRGAKMPFECEGCATAIKDEFGTPKQPEVQQLVNAGLIKKKSRTVWVINDGDYDVVARRGPGASRGKPGRKEPRKVVPKKRKRKGTQRNATQSHTSTTGDSDIQALADQIGEEGLDGRIEELPLKEIRQILSTARRIKETEEARERVLRAAEEIEAAAVEDQGTLYLLLEEDDEES